MGIPGILKEIGKGERIALAKLAVQHLERTQRPLRVAIDAAIWNFQSQAGQGGKNPALRTLYYRLLRLLALPIHPLFVYDGKNKPLLKRGKAVSRWGTCIANETSKKLIKRFSFPCHTAPGEAEAECAALQKHGIVDMVMSQDGDAVMFGSGITLRDWSKEGTRGNKSPTHVNMIELSTLKQRSGLDPDGMILVALLSGGDYDQDGVAGFGAALACEAARAGFGTDLLKLVKQNDERGLEEWRERLQYELETNESGYFKRKHKTIKIPVSFPNRTILEYYINPVVSKETELKDLEQDWTKVWDSNFDAVGLRQYVAEAFDWQYKPGAWKFVRTLSPSLLAHKLLRSQADQCVSSIDQITERRQHFINDGIPELRIQAIPAEVVAIDLDAEEDSPEFLARFDEEQDNEAEEQDHELPSTQQTNDEQPTASQSPTRTKKRPAWSPFTPEKVWISESVVQLGVPAMVEDWHQLQRDIRADPRRFIMRNSKKSSKKRPDLKTGSIEQYLRIQRTETTNALDSTQQHSQRLPLSQPENETTVPKTPQKRVAKLSTKRASPSMDRFFKITKPTMPAILLQQPNIQIAAKSSKVLSTSDSINHTDTSDPAPRQPQKPGTSHDPIVLTSSPSNDLLSQNMTQQKPTTPKRAAVSVELSDGSDSDPVLPASVTTRRKRTTRRQSVHATGSEALDGSPKRASARKPPTPVISPTGQAIQSSDSGRQVCDQLPSDPSTGLNVDFTSKKDHALPRESLPGTWKDATFEDAARFVKSSKQSRISCVDLTGD